MARRLVNTRDTAEDIARALGTDELRRTLAVFDWWLTDDRLSEASAARMRAARDVATAELRRREGARHDA